MGAGVTQEGILHVDGAGGSGSGLTNAELRLSPVPVTSDGLTDVELRASPVEVFGTFTAIGGLTDAELRATPVPVSGTVITGGLTDTQLRALAVAVSGPFLTDTQLRATAVPVTTGDLTNTQLRATPVPVSGPLTNTELRAVGVTVVAGVGFNVSSITNPVSVKPAAVGAATVASVAASVTTVNIFGFGASNTVFRSIFNDSTSTLYIKFGTVASLTDYSLQIPPGAFFEFPTPVYYGTVTGLWVAAVGAAKTTLMVI